MSGVTTKVMLAGAALWSAALVVASLTLPVYSGEEASTSADGSLVTRSTSATLVDVNGLWGAVLAAVPLAVTVLVSVLVSLRSHRSARLAAWACVAALGLLALAGLASVGLFFAPVFVALTIAVASAPTPRDGPGTRPLHPPRPSEL